MDAVDEVDREQEGQDETTALEDNRDLAKQSEKKVKITSEGGVRGNKISIISSLLWVTVALTGVNDHTPIKFFKDL